MRLFDIEKNGQLNRTRQDLYLNEYEKATESDLINILVTV